MRVTVFSGHSGARVSANPESRNTSRISLWIPGSLAEPVIGPRFARTRWLAPRNDDWGFPLFGITRYTCPAMPNLLILTEVQEAMRARYKAMLLEQFPQLTINVVGHHSLVDPYIAGTDILLCFSPPMADHVVRDAPKLKWIQALGTGVDNIIDLPSLGKEVLVTNIRGIHGAPVSEATIAYMLSLARDLPRSVHAQDRSAWERWPSALLAGKTVGILGVGLIAEYLAPICKALHMTVIGISGSPRAAKSFDRMVARGDLVKVARRDSTIWWCSLRSRAETRDIIGEKVFAAMKPTAYLVNVARGGVVDEPALIGRAGRPARSPAPRSTCSRRSRCRPTTRCGRPRT